MDLKKHQYLLVYAAAGVLTVWLVSRVIFTPFHARLTGLGRDVLLQEARLKKGISLIERQDEINKEYDKYASYFSLHDLSDEEAVSNFLKEVEKTSREAALAVVDMKQQKEVKKDKFSKQYTINIRAEGTMPQLVNFLYALHNSSILFTVEKMSISPKSEESPDLNITLTMVGVSFL